MPKIVVIDDDDLFRNYLVAALTEQGYEIIAAADGLEGLQLIESEAPDLVLTDIVMPEVEGVEVILKVKSINPNIPIIAMSGGNLGDSSSYLGMAGKLGAHEVLAKPFDRSVLLGHIEKLLNAN